jgi:adenosylcobinamide-phosphate synthase
VPLNQAASRPLGIALGVGLDLVAGDPRRNHPVAGFGRAAEALERRWYADDVRRGAAYAALGIGVPLALGFALEAIGRGRPVLRTAVTAAATWMVLGGTSLAREGASMAVELETGQLLAARSRLSNLCARDPSRMDAGDLARATVESLAENASDAVVAPLLWGAVAGVPGLLGYRAANTLDAIVGYTSVRYLRFGRAAARFDDLVNLAPARVTGALIAVLAPLAGGSPLEAWRVLRRDGARHPSPNAGRPEAATAGALGVRLGGENVYAGHVERRPSMGTGRDPEVRDVRRAVRLGRAVAVAAGVLAVGVAAGIAAIGSRAGHAWPRRRAAGF